MTVYQMNIMTIQTIDDLLNFVDSNYDNLSDTQYIEICRTTMHLYEYRKPQTKQMALERINELYKLAQKYESVQDMPLFLN